MNVPCDEVPNRCIAQASLVVTSPLAFSTTCSALRPPSPASSDALIMVGAIGGHPVFVEHTFAQASICMGFYTARAFVTLVRYARSAIHIHSEHVPSSLTVLVCAHSLSNALYSDNSAHRALASHEPVQDHPKKNEKCSSARYAPANILFKLLYHFVTTYPVQLSTVVGHFQDCCSLA